MPEPENTTESAAVDEDPADFAESTTEPDLEAIDLSASTRKYGHDQLSAHVAGGARSAPAALAAGEPSAGHSHADGHRHSRGRHAHRRSDHGSASRIGRSAHAVANRRRIEVILIVALTLVAVAILFRACSAGGPASAAGLLLFLPPPLTNPSGGPILFVVVVRRPG